MGRETNIQTAILNEAAIRGINLWRNNRGLFLTLDGKRKVRSGLETKGSSDLIGILPVTVTQEMVGKTVGVFLGAEIKTDSGATYKEQKDFIALVQQHGGIAGICRSVDDFRELLLTFGTK